MDAPDRYGELRKLIAALREGVLDEAGARRLNEMLVADPDARRLYAKYSMLQSCLELEYGTALAPAGPVPPKATRAGFGRLVASWREATGLIFQPARLALVAGLMAAAFLAGMGIVWWLPRSEEPVTRPEARQPGPIVARVVRTQDCVWADATDAPCYQSALEAGRQLRLSHGMIEIAYSSGARVIVAGPAEFVLESEKSARLVCGRIVADVPKEASGFAVSTQRVQVVDLGTEFGLSVDKDGASEVQVYRGRAEVRSLDAKTSPKPLQLEVNQAARFSPKDGLLKPVSVESVQLRKPRFTPISPKPTKVEHDDGGLLEANQGHSGPIIADFSDGPGAAKPDQFVGTAGEGWLGGWQARSSKNIDTSHNVTRKTPLTPDGGSFLQVEHKAPARVPYNVHPYLWRRYGDTRDISLAQPHTVSWRFRLDKCPGFRHDRGDAIRFFDYSADPALERRLEDDLITWHIQAHEPGQAFRLSDGYAYSGWVRTDVVMTLKHVYEFVVRVDPGNNQYRVTITDLGHQPGDPGKAAYESGNLRFCNSPEDPRRVGGTLVMGAMLGGARPERPQNALTWLIYSLDRVEIAPIRP